MFFSSTSFFFFIIKKIKFFFLQILFFFAGEEPTKIFSSVNNSDYNLDSTHPNTANFQIEYDYTLTLHRVGTSSFVHSFVHLFVRSFIRSFVYSFVHLFIHSFIRLFIHLLFIYSFVNLFLHTFIISTPSINLTLIRAPNTNPSNNHTSLPMMPIVVVAWQQ